VQGLPVDRRQTKPLEPPLTRLPVRTHSCKCVMPSIDIDQPKLLIAAARRIAVDLVETAAVVAQDPERNAERGDLKNDAT
jgi:hypothetical protein